MAFPFCPMTDEVLKKLSWTIQDSNSTINSPYFAAVFVSQESKIAPELNSQRLEIDQSDTPH